LCYVDELNIRLRLNKEGAAILQTSVVGAVPATDESAEQLPPEPSHSGQQKSLDFEIEPEAYRAVEALVKSLSAGALFCLSYKIVFFFLFFSPSLSSACFPIFVLHYE